MNGHSDASQQPTDSLASSGGTTAPAGGVSSQPPRRWRWWAYVLFALVVCLIAGVAGAALYLRPYTPSADALAAMRGDSQVSVSQTSEYIAFIPHTPSTTGLIFYPGAKVEPAAYAVYMREIAAQGYDAFILKVPLNIALLAQDQAQTVIDAYPGVTHWAVGGHSLGGVAASAFAGSQRSVRGLLLYASYPNNDLSQRTDLAVVSISGSRDGLATPAKVDAAKHLLPPTTVYVVIDGGIHSYFGDYGHQDGDNSAAISRDAARQQVIAASVALLDAIASGQPVQSAA